mmetsp:Transcript_116387/g.325553  ORF Transcript_116387/g.325553 Transcript_116387/m.325553 type:complete len:210 (+) Transcript_116387:493-1122(+)
MMSRYPTKVLLDADGVTMDIICVIVFFGCLGRLASGFVVPVRSDSKLCNLVHFTGSNLDLHVPLFSVPFSACRVVQGLVAVEFWIGNVILEARSFGMRSPTFQAQLLRVVAESSFSRSGHFIRLVFVLLLGIEDDTQSKSIRYLQNVIEPVAKHLLPGRVRFLNSGSDGEVFNTVRENRIVLQKFRHFGLDFAQNMSHALANIRLIGDS